MREELRAGRSRSVLTGLSLLVGVLAVVGVQTAGSLASGILVAKSEQRYGRAYTAHVDATVAQVDQLTMETLTTHLSTALPRSVVEVLDADLSLVPDAPPGSPVGPDAAPVRLVSGDLDLVYRNPIRLGQPFSAAGAHCEISVNRAGWQHFFDATPRRTTAIVIGLGAPVRVRLCGVFDDGSPSPTVLSSISRMHARMAAPLPGRTLRIWGSAGAGSPEAVKNALYRLVADTGLSRGEAVQDDQIEDTRDVVTRLRQAFLFSAVIALVVACLGILNIGLAGVRERSRELVIRRAVGASRRQIFWPIVGASLTIGLFTCAVAILVTELVVARVEAGLVAETPLSGLDVPVSAYLSGVLAAGLTSVLGALVPAVKASRVQVADILRE